MNQKPYKYYFHDLMRNRAQPLPADVNDVLRAAVMRLECETLISLIDKIQNERLFGDVQVYDNRGVLISKIEFHLGIAKTIKVIENPDDMFIVRPLHPLFLRSHRNWLISWKEGPKNGSETV